MAVVIYGIKNCNTMQKAFKWLDNHDISYQFHDYKKEGIDKKQLQQFIDTFGWQNVINRKGMTWRKLTKKEQENVNDNSSAIELMVQKPAMIKRPIITTDNNHLIGFDEDEYKKTLSN